MAVLVDGIFYGKSLYCVSMVLGFNAVSENTVVVLYYNSLMETNYLH